MDPLLYAREHDLDRCSYGDEVIGRGEESLLLPQADQRRDGNDVWFKG